MPSVERNGISGPLLQESLEWVGGLPPVAAYLATLPQKCRVAVRRFLVHICYSVHAVQTIKEHGGLLSENSLAIGVGEHVQLIDDVECLTRLWRATRVAGLGCDEGVTYLQFAHDLVRPNIVTALAHVVLLERAPPTRAYMAELLQRLVKRHGIGKLQGSKDAMRLNRTQTRAHMFAGTGVLKRKLKPKTWPSLVKLSKAIVDLSKVNGTISQLADEVVASKLPGLRTKKYWNLHLSRLFTPGFAIQLPGSIEIDPKGIVLLHGMGEGSEALGLLNIDKHNANTEVPRLCNVVEGLCGRMGCQMQVTPAHMVVAACESHRRDGLRTSTAAIRRRPGN